MRGKKFFALLVVVIIVGFTSVVAYGQTDPVAATPVAATEEEAEPEKLVISARQEAAANRKLTKEISGEAIEQVEYDLGEDESDVGSIVSKIILIVVLVVLLLLIVLAFAKIGALKRLLVKAGVIEEEEPPEENKPNQSGFSLVSLLFGIVAIGLIVALLAPVAFAATDKTARQAAAANLDSIRNQRANIVTVNGKADEAITTAKAAKEAAEKADSIVADAQAKVNQMLAGAQAKVNQMVKEAGTGDAAAIKEFKEDLKSVKQRYILQGGDEEKAVLGYIVIAAGVDLADEPELKNLIGEYKGTKQQREKFRELLAAARPATVTPEQFRDTNEALVKVVQVTTSIANVQKTSVSREYVIGAIADSRKVLEDKMAANLETMKALVDNLDTSKVEKLDQKVDKVAEAAALGAAGETGPALDVLAGVYDKNWVRDVLKNLPAPAAD